MIVILGFGFVILGPQVLGLCKFFVAPSFSYFKQPLFSLFYVKLFILQVTITRVLLLYE